MVLALLIGFFLLRDIARTASQVATAAKGLAVGDLNQKITVHSGDELGQMADGFRSMIAYQHEMADVASAMAMGDLTQNVAPKGTHDVLGIAFEHMAAKLRAFVSDLQQHTATLSSQAQLLEHFQVETFDVVLTDLGLGSGMDGWQLAGRVQRDWPGVGVILASGGTGIEVVEARTRGVAALLSKPYQADDFRRAVIDVSRTTTQQAV
jgi:methyl-accepting chemotaxis protein